MTGWARGEEVGKKQKLISRVFGYQLSDVNYFYFYSALFAFVYLHY